ncbi:uncharacterized mitochondrial protein-like protein, partial [Tanacetum coccineum]
MVDSGATDHRTLLVNSRPHSSQLSSNAKVMFGKWLLDASNYSLRAQQLPALGPSHTLTPLHLTFSWCPRETISVHHSVQIDRHKAVLVAQVAVKFSRQTLSSSCSLEILHHDIRLYLGALNYFLGLEVAYTDNGLFLTQSKYARDILKRADLYDSKPVSTPLATHVSFTADGIPYSDSTLYRSLVGALQYLTITRPDLSYAVNQVSQFLHAPTIAHFQSVKRILRYVKGTISFGLTFSRPHTNTIIGYSDADWARCLDTRRSTYGYSIYLGGNLVSWSAKKQPTVSRSSCESEYRAMANTAAEIVWITHLLQELHALPPDRPTLLCDNKSALFMTQNPVSHKRAKHIDLDYHFIRELVHSGKLYTKFVPTNLQVADIFTKSLPRSQFETFRTMLHRAVIDGAQRKRAKYETKCADIGFGFLLFLILFLWRIGEGCGCLTEADPIRSKKVQTSTWGPTE